jgi:hypothetical protein
MDAALAAGAQLVINDQLAIQKLFESYGTIETAAGLLHDIPYGALNTAINTIATDCLALQALVTNDPFVP